MKIRTLLLAVTATTLLAAAPIAEAADSPPPVRLRASTGSKPLEPWAYMWTTPTQTAEGPGCTTVVADGIPGYDQVITTRFSRARPMVIIGSDEKPRVLGFRSYSALNDDGFPRGNGERVGRDLKPLTNDFGEPSAWAIVFRVNSNKRPYFDLHLGFGAPNRCAQDRTEGGDAYYSFGVGHD